MAKGRPRKVPFELEIKLIELLNGAGRRTITELAVDSGLSKTYCRTGMKNLVKLGVVKKNTVNSKHNQPIDVYSCDETEIGYAEAISMFAEMASCGLTAELDGFGNAVDVDSDDHGDPYAEGWDAFDEGHSDEWCFYQKSSNKYRLWMAGYRSKEAAVRGEEIRCLRQSIVYY